ncbi:membrane fusion protein (multidrug efflux system) [Natronocella acetinitrilica]|uniref:Membrane fusion protein (Multidrug efflux system) n=1 Tax=Natronocella acetinitrilica TaxID=414046 RepID=A0AAE3KDM8_9GAMM|nr:efflux RND transporter periplasmic adaptor subunit [Natronocella acetinitrilica]MCP1677029.1 membrane fusion protein (multidrug efflux system) [Natronocella acetinitrilica]
MRLVYQLLGVAMVAGIGVGAWFAIDHAGQGDASAAGPRGGGGGGAVPVEVVAARTSTVERTVTAVGTTLARESIDVVAEVPGRIRSINFEEGQRVSSGDILFELDRRREEADLRELQAQVRDAERRLRRSRALFEDNSVPEAQVDEDGAALETLQARLSAAETRLDERYIRAPFDGVTGLREVSTGAFVSAGTPLTTLDDIGRLRLEFSVPERFLGLLRSGLAVSAESVGFEGRDFSGEVRRVGARVDPVSRSVRVQSELQNDDRLLRPGMFMTVRMVLDRNDDAVLVPEEALLPEGERVFLFRINDEKAERVQVRTGVRRDGLVEITDGISAGDLVVIAGLQRLRDGVTVRITREHEEDEVARRWAPAGES